MAVIDHITTNNSATYEVQDTVARTKANNLESVNYTDIGGGFADGNTFLVKTNDGMKKGYLNNFANWILDKLATKVYNQLATSNKTMIGALNELDSKIIVKNIYDTDVEKYFSTLKGNQIAFLYFGANNTNLPNIDNITWKYFSAIIIKTRAFIFSPAGYPNKIATRQFVDTSWRDWNSIK